MIRESKQHQAPLIPAEGKKAINDWLKTNKKGRADFKAAADENKKSGEIFSGLHLSSSRSFHKRSIWPAPETAAL